jgi:hypothetical protein
MQGFFAVLLKAAVKQQPFGSHHVWVYRGVVIDSHLV